jgi:hypothetical protein
MGMIQWKSLKKELYRLLNSGKELKLMGLRSSCRVSLQLSTLELITHVTWNCAAKQSDDQWK